MKKVGILIDTPFSLGGVQRVSTVLANYLNDNGFDVSFLVFGRNIRIDYDVYGLNESVHLVRMDEYNRTAYRILRRIPYELKKVKNSRNLFGMTLQGQLDMFAGRIDAGIIAKYVNDLDLDYVIGPAIENTVRLAVARKQFTRAKVIGWQHSCYQAYFETPGIRMYNLDKASEFTFENIDRYVVQTRDDHDRILKRFGYDATVINNPNTFNSDQTSTLTARNFLAAGRFVPLKGFDRLLEAFRKFAETDKEWKLVLVGEGPEKENYQELISRHGIQDRVIMPGRSNRMEDHYLNASVYLMTSQWEGWGMTVAEAMEYGLPVISFDIPSMHEIFGETECGIIVPMNDVEAMAKAMTELTCDPERLRRLGHNGEKQIEQFDADIVCRRWLEILK
ncbi:MAG: glycosyltransferase family 4 protein [Erysipelotrichaceae bacterium]|nr:glycosyltransferase family 4 protein [Erysipelotrichaceae bacterium]